MAGDGTPLLFGTRTASVTVNGLNTIYTANNPTDWAEFMLADKFLPANTDGWFAIDGVPNVDGTSAVIGFNTSNLNQSFAQYEYFSWISLGNFYRGTNGSAVTNTGVAAAGKFRLRRASGTISLQASNDGGVSWGTVYTWPGTQNAALYVNANFSANGILQNPIVSGGFTV